MNKRKDTLKRQKNRPPPVDGGYVLEGLIQLDRIGDNKFTGHLKVLPGYLVASHLLLQTSNCLHFYK